MAILAAAPLYAGGPKYVAGATYFDPAALGQPLHWPGGKVNYYVDKGPLNATVTNQQATAMVDAAAALWNGVATAGVSLVDKGQLNEDVSGTNILVNKAGVIAAPADVTPAATNYPVAVIFDADGAVIDALYGVTASEPGACQENGVFVRLDGYAPQGTFTHAEIVLNGRCATSAGLMDMMSFDLERAFGRILGLDYSQVNANALKDGIAGGTLGWPVMQPTNGLCGPFGGDCIPNPTVLRYDDIAALNRLYPIKASNLADFPGKKITAANTISIQGTIRFATGYGMQGVNVAARPLDANGNPMYQYTVTAVTGALFNGEHGNPVTGWKDDAGNLLTNWGLNDAAQQGYFDLSGIPLPPEVSSATYQVSFEAVDPLNILGNSVGPYVDGQVAPSGTMNVVTLSNLSAGAAQTVNVTGDGSATGAWSDAIGRAAQPRQLPASGMWFGRLSQVGQTDWFTFPVRGGRTFTIVTVALDETSAPAEQKAMPSIGIWDAFDSPDADAVGAAAGLNGMATGETWLRVSASGDDMVRVAVADRRGDGRPDYAYNGWVLYADSVEPARLLATGGPIVIHGMGFRSNDTVMVGGEPAVVLSISPNEITAIAPPAAMGVTGSVDVEVDDEPIYYAAAIVTGGTSYDSATGDALTLVTAPMNTVPTNVPLPFTVTALGPEMNPAGGVTVVYTVVSGTAKLGCGVTTCSVIATGDGRATMNMTAVDNTWSIVTASLLNGASLQAQFAGGTAATVTALTGLQSVAAGATVTWTVQALALQGGSPASGQSVVFQPVSGIAVQGSATATTNSSGIATESLTVGPLAKDQTATIKACLNGTSQCATFTVVGARPELGYLSAVSGTSQSLAVSATPQQIVFRLLDVNGNSMAGGTVSFYQSLYAWTQPCSAHVVCAPGALLGTQSGTAVSALDGTVTFSPGRLPGVATSLRGLALSGNSSTVDVAIEQK